MTENPHAALAPPWGDHPLPEGEELRTVTIGPLTLWARCTADEIWLAHQSGDWTHRSERRDAGPPSEEEGWTRWPVPDETAMLRLEPVFPPRTLVIKPELSFRLLPGAHGRIFVRVPLWVRAVAAGPEQHVLTEIPSVVLSDTWWGEFTEGELCYWLSTSARRRITPDIFHPHLVVCPLDLTNRSDGELEVEKIALRVDHLSVFRGENGFWSDVTRVKYRGAAEGSEIEVSGRAPTEAGSDAARITEPRAGHARSFSARTFSRLRSLSGMGAE